MKMKYLVWLIFFPGIAESATFFNDRVSVQGYLKVSNAALNDATGFPMQFLLKQNGSVVWCQSSASNIPVVTGIFSHTLSGISNCQSLSNPLAPAVFAHTSNSDLFTVDVKVDFSKDGFGGADDVTFAGIELVASPLAIYANQANLAKGLSSTLELPSGGTGATTAAGARTNLGLGPLSTLTLSGVSTDFLKGDGTFGPIGTVALSNGGTGGTTAAAARTNLGLGPLSTLTLSGVSTDFLKGDGTFGALSGVVTTVAGRSGAVTLQSADITDAASTNTSSRLVIRDASGNFSAGTITASLSGNATNVTGTVAVANGGTGGTTAEAARTNLGSAASGANTDITSITGTARLAQTVGSVTTGGTTTAYTLTNSPVIAAYSTGQRISLRINATNTGAATINVDGLGARSIFSRLTGAAVAAGDLRLNEFIFMTYDGTNFLADIPPRYYTATSLNCGASIAAGSFVTCPNITAANVNAGDLVNCSPSADPAAGTVTWSALATAGNISVRLACSNGASTCALTNRNWRCIVSK